MIAPSGTVDDPIFCRFSVGDNDLDLLYSIVESDWVASAASAPLVASPAAKEASCTRSTDDAVATAS